MGRGHYHDGDTGTITGEITIMIGGNEGDGINHLDDTLYEDCFSGGKCTSQIRNGHSKGRRDSLNNYIIETLHHPCQFVTTCSISNVVASLLKINK